MTTHRKALYLTAAGLLAASFTLGAQQKPAAPAASAKPTVSVYKSPT